MAGSAQLRLKDVRRASRLLCELIERRQDSVTWLQHMLDYLPRVTGADFVLCGQHGLALPGILSPATFIAFSQSWTSAQRDVILRAFNSGAIHADPTYRRSLEIPTRLYVHRPQDLVSDEEWRDSAVYRECVSAGVDSLVNLRFSSPITRRFINIVVYRSLGRKPLPQRTNAILRFFGRELLHTLERAAKVDVNQALPPREEEVLNLLRHGLAEKEVASRLDLSAHTVHDYTKSLYKRFSVSSRAELLSVVQRAQAAQGGMSFPDELPPGLDWGFNMGRSEMAVTD